jgi:hypothetical protein
MSRSWRSSDKAKLRMYKVSGLRRWALVTCAVLVFLIPVLALRQLPYDTEYEVIEYSSRPPSDSVARLRQKIDSGEVELQFEAKGGYLESLLRQLKIPVASQMLVFSKTSFQPGLISSRTPRAIYFNDDVYVAWVQDSPVLEISSLDPELGPVFYTLSQNQSSLPEFKRETHLCLRCHDSYSLTGGGVPRYILGSGFADKSGRLVSHEGWHLTTDQTPLSRRWGGWYVTGTHGHQVHMGNLVPKDAAEAVGMDLAAGANLIDLGKLIDTSPYLTKHSDIVALMVIEHQAHLQNLITRVNWETRRALQRDAVQEREPGHDPAQRSTATLKGIESVAESLVRALLFVDEAPLGGPITGTSGFADAFVAQGPWDGRDRSLRQLDLTGRLFRYPLSYLIYSEAFDALPDLAREYVYRRLREVLGGQDKSEGFAHLSEESRLAISEILEDTKNDFPGP